MDGIICERIRSPHKNNMELVALKQKETYNLVHIK